MKKSEILNRINPLFLKGVAHRGLHDREYEKICENSMSAFKNARDHKVAFELDVHLTKDKKLLVCHDSNLKRVTGKEGEIELLTLKELKENYRLLNGEELPTLEEVLEEIKEEVPIVIELKGYSPTKNYKELALKVHKALEVVKDKRNIILISFQPQCLVHFKKEEYIRSLLVCKESAWVFALRHFFEGVDLDWVLFKEEKYQKVKKDKLVMCWTLENENDINEIKDYVDSITYQYVDPDWMKNL